MPCTKTAKHEYDGMKLCQTHFLKKKKSEECPICYCDMQKDCIRLGCGHMFHGMCISKNPSQTCPMCRATYDDKTKSRIASLRLTALMPKITELNELVQRTVALSLEALTGSHPEVAAMLNNVNLMVHHDNSCKQVVQFVLQRLVDHLNKYGTMTGFHVILHNNGTVTTSV